MAWTVDARSIARGDLRPGQRLRVAPFGADDIGEPQPCVVFIDPDALVKWCVVVDAKGRLITAKTERGLRSAAARLGLAVAPNEIYLP